MNAQTAVSEYVVMRSPKLKFEVIQKTYEGIETSTYLSKLEEKWVSIIEGTETECKNYKTKGQLFKEKHGMSLTMAKNIRKQGGLSMAPITDFDITVYKSARKDRKKVQKLYN